jgi:O-antigen ligase
METPATEENRKTGHLIAWLLMTAGSPFSTAVRSGLGSSFALLWAVPKALITLFRSPLAVLNPLTHPWTFPLAVSVIAALGADPVIPSLRKTLPRLIIPVTMFLLSVKLIEKAGDNTAAETITKTDTEGYDRLKLLLMTVVPLVLASVLGVAGWSRTFENHNLIAGLTLMWTLPLLHFAFFPHSQNQNMSFDRESSGSIRPRAIFFSRLLAALAGLAGLYLIFRLHCLGAVIGFVGALGSLLFLKKPRWAAILFIVILISLQLPAAKGQIQSIVNKKTSVFRILAWKHAMSKVWNRPLLGHGPGSCKVCMSDLKWPAWAVLSEIPEHPHSLGLLILLETGFAGAFAFAAALLGIFISMNERGRFLLCGILIHNSVTSLFIDSGYAVALFTLLGLHWQYKSKGSDINEQ